MAFVRANHPDLGGDRAVFEAGLARYRSIRRGVDRYRAEPEPERRADAEVVEVVSVTPLQRWVDRIRRRYRRQRRTRVQ